MVRYFVKRNSYAVLFYALLFCFFQYCIVKLYGFSIFPDEFSYWAYAAEAAGHEWSDVISLGSFYSYGYSMVLFPIFYFCQSSLTAYRVAVALNFILIGLLYLILCRISAGMTADKTENCQMYAAIAVFYPALIFYAQTTMAETLLALGYLLLAMLLGRYLRRRRYTDLILIFLLNFYMYLVHMRTIGTLAVSTGVLICYEILCKRKTKVEQAAQTREIRKRIALMLFGAVLAVGAVYLLNQKVTQNLYHDLDSELYEINTYEGQLQKLTYIFSKEGLIAFLAGFCGKILYLGIGTYGTAYWGMLYLARNIFGKEKGEKFYISIFLLSATLAQISISTVYNVIPEGCDSITYGRYQDYVTPILIVLGIKEIVQRVRYWKRYLAFTGLLLSALLVIIVTYIDRLGLTGMKGYFMAGMSYFELRQFRPVLFYGISFLTSIFCMGIFTAILLQYSKRRHSYILCLCIVVQLLAAMRLGKNYLYPFNELAYQDIKLAEKIEGLMSEEKYDSFITYIDCNAISAIGLIQFTMRNTEIKTLSECGCGLQDGIDENSIVLLGADTPIQEELERVYDREIISGHFVLIYNDAIE